jgi:hypothetical protein
MKKELDPKVFGPVIGALVLLAAIGLFLGLRGQGDRSGPLVPAKYEGGKSFGGGWHPGATQKEMLGGGAPKTPGSDSGTKSP